MNDNDFDLTFLEKSASLCAFNHKAAFLDSIACELHNRGYELLGNTEESDIEWFARTLWQSVSASNVTKKAFNSFGLVPDRCWTKKYRWEALSDAERGLWTTLATACIAVIPALQSRIGSRLVAISQCVRLMAKNTKSP
jgi:hypothetical protein